MKRIVEKLKLTSLWLCLIASFASVAGAQQRQPARDEVETTPAEALRRYEKGLQETTNPRSRFYLTTKAAPTALAAGETEKAKGYALLLLEQAAAQQKSWNHGNAVHVGNLVLGQIALEAADLSEAKRLLLEAGKTRGSAQLDTFGPNMRLAKELLTKGERDVVIQYFELCARFWTSGNGRLNDWKAAVIGGRVPDFRANLNYQITPWRFQDWARLPL